MRVGVTCVLALLIAACNDAGAFECTADDQCMSNGVAGFCEPNGFCSFPDDSCESGKAYGALAGMGLAGKCVAADDEPTTGVAGTTEDDGTGDPTVADDDADSSSGTGPALTSGESSGDSTSDSGSSTGEAPGCVDEDGDGFGVGADCEGDDCDDMNANTAAGCVHISPDGDDDNPGTLDAPVLTFTKAVSLMSAGSSLVLLDGEYDEGTTGLPLLDCNGAAPDGTDAMPVYMRALNERQAHITAGGDGALRLEHCSEWRVHGLHLSGSDVSPDNGGTTEGVAAVRQSQGIELRRLLVREPNRYRENEGLIVSESTGVLVEECEFYDFASAAVFVFESDGVFVRRCFAASRGFADLAGCVPTAPLPTQAQCSDNAGVGDEAFEAEDSASVTFENCLSRDNYRGFRLEAGFLDNALMTAGGVDNAVLGSVSYGDVIGVVASFGSDGVTTLPIDGARIEDTAVLYPESRGVELESAFQSTVDHVTVYGAGGDRGIFLDFADMCFPTCSATVSNSLSINAATTGIELQVGTNGIAEFCNSVGSTDSDYLPIETIDDAAGDIQMSSAIAVPEVGPGDGQCLVYVPDDSAVGTLDEAGGPIGATVVERWVDGAPTGDALWDPDTGAFPCGAVLAGINDDASSCSIFHELVGLDDGTCPVPSP